MPRVQELRTGLWWWEAEHPEWTPEDAGTEDWGLIPDSITQRSDTATPTKTASDRPGE